MNEATEKSFHIDWISYWLKWKKKKKTYDRHDRYRYDKCVLAEQRREKQKKKCEPNGMWIIWPIQCLHVGQVNIFSENIKQFSISYQPSVKWNS